MDPLEKWRRGSKRRNNEVIGSKDNVVRGFLLGFGQGVSGGGMGRGGKPDIGSFSLPDWAAVEVGPFRFLRTATGFPSAQPSARA